MFPSAQNGMKSIVVKMEMLKIVDNLNMPSSIMVVHLDTIMHTIILNVQIG